jgi:ATP:ADP antiporter, AAA family
VTLFFVSNILAFYFAGRLGLQIAVPFFLWVGIFNVMVIAQFWAFVNDLNTPEQGKRLLPIVGLGSSLGAWVGSVYAGDVIRATGPYSLMLLAAAVLSTCVVIALFAERSHARIGSSGRLDEGSEPLENIGGFALIRQQRYLSLIASMVVLLNVVNSSGEYLFGRFVVDASIRACGAGAASLAIREQFVGGTYARLFSYVNLCGFLLQLFVVSRVFKHLGVAKALFIHPLVVLAGYAALLKGPSMTTMEWLKICDNSIDYSLGNTAKQALWLPTSRAANYKAKQAVDAFFMRAGDVLQAGVVFVGGRFALTVSSFAVVNVGLAVGWLALVAALNPAYRQQLRTLGSAAGRESSAVPAIVSRERIIRARPRSLVRQEG